MIIAFALLITRILSETEEERDSRLGVGVFHNPMFEPSLPDPSFLRAHDGYFYAYGTENVWNGKQDRKLTIVRSPDMVKWEYIGDAFTHMPEWGNEGAIWAPKIVYRPERQLYYLYFAFCGGNFTCGVGLAVSEQPYGPFEDTGRIMDSIDPYYIETGSGLDKKRYIFWGSWSGINGVEMADDMKTMIGEPFMIVGQHAEGSFLYEKDGYFFFFGSSGSCCEGNRSTYHVTMGRSSNIKGPYMSREGKALLIDSEGSMLIHGDWSADWIATGHNGEIIKDDLGRYFFLYHGIDPYNSRFPDKQRSYNTRRPLFMDEIIWDEDGWPTVEESVASSRYKRAPYFRK
jgi:arabinan endo-1,5-alpha-L-arabinosidase